MYRQLRPPTGPILKAIYSTLKIKYPEVFSKSAKILDLFAGTGSFGLLMLSKVEASYCIFVEKTFSSCLEIEKKCRIKYPGSYKVIRSDVFRINIKMQFDIVFIDPPYMFNLSTKILEIVEKQCWVNNNTVICLRKNKDEPMSYSGKLEIDHEYINGYNQTLFLKLKK